MLFPLFLLFVISVLRHDYLPVWLVQSTLSYFVCHVKLLLRFLDIMICGFRQNTDYLSPNICALNGMVPSTNISEHDFGS